jgi:hypothetical protein
MAGNPRAKATDEELAAVVAASTSVTEALKKLGSRLDGHFARELLARTKRIGIDTSHFVVVPGRPPRSTGKTLRRPASEVLVRLAPGSHRTAGRRLTFALIETGVEYRCAIKRCSVSGEWLGEKMVLQVDHIDGDGYNNLKENLRFLCPNCHSQTSNFAGRKNARPRYCSTCHQEIGKKGESGTCTSCMGLTKRKIEWPSDQELAVMLASSNFVQVGKVLGVSDNAVRKHLGLVKK